MVNANCVVCKKAFYAKPSFISRGWGRYCSSACHYLDARSRRELACSECGIKILRTKSQVSKSKSGKFFCSKSCQTTWRNQQFVGEKHANWRHGKDTYKSILTRLKIPAVCSVCKTVDRRVLAVHHRDHNHDNNDKENLAWLCHNCHYGVHHDSVMRRKFMVPMV